MDGRWAGALDFGARQSLLRRPAGVRQGLGGRSSQPGGCPVYCPALSGGRSTSLAALDRTR